ncbi:MAG: TetR family transcriptional regulator [Bacilli bacterium]|nr:TetR family transcriptional regulator [Bacilli bacterium]
MPTNTFYNLNKNKQEKIINAAIKEFSEKTFTEASINNIIKEASIPRGSFYMYFEDKNDLYHTIIHEFKDKIKEIFKLNFIKNNGDIFNSFISIFDDITNYIFLQNNLKFFKNFFCNMNAKNEKFMMPPHKHDHKNVLNEEIKNLIDISNLNISNEDELSDVFDMLVTLLIRKIIMTIAEDEEVENMKNSYKNQINFIKNGLYRED